MKQDLAGAPEALRELEARMQQLDGALQNELANV